MERSWSEAAAAALDAYPWRARRAPARGWPAPNGGISVTARGDFTITSIKISPETWAEAAGGKPERFETMLFNVINGALKSVKKTTQEQMMAAMKGGGMPNLFGK